jgi:peptidase S41-like protein
MRYPLPGSASMGSACLALALLGACPSARGQDAAITPAERAEVVRNSVARLNAEYIDPGLAKRMGESISSQASRNGYEGIGNGQALADRLTADLRAVSHDKHLWVGYQPGGARDEPVDGPTDAELDQWRDAVARDNFAFDKVERMQGNIGYVKFRIFAYPYLAAETAAAAMTFVAHTDALIVDLRDNIGGEPAMVSFMLSYLFDGPTHLNDIQFRNGNQLRQYWTLPHVPGQRFGGTKPLYVLTSRTTFSAAEDFAYALKNSKRAKIVGEASGGGAHPSRAFKVSEHFVVSIPYARSVSPITHDNWEGKGVLPDIAVPADQALAVAYRAALEQLADQSADDDRKKELRGLLEKGASP